MRVSSTTVRTNQTQPPDIHLENHIVGSNTNVVHYTTVRRMKPELLNFIASLVEQCICHIGCAFSFGLVAVTDSLSRSCILLRMLEAGRRRVWAAQSLDFCSMGWYETLTAVKVGTVYFPSKLHTPRVRRVCGSSS